MRLQWIETMSECIVVLYGLVRDELFEIDLSPLLHAPLPEICSTDRPG